jgi:hypothetical protein
MEKDVFVNNAVRNIPVHNIFPQRANFVINSVNNMSPKKVTRCGRGLIDAVAETITKASFRQELRLERQNLVVVELLVNSV